MKLIKIILPVCLLFAMSCKRLIEPKVSSSLTDANAFQSKDDAIAAVNAVYARLKNPSGANDSWRYYAGYQMTITDFTTDIGHSSASGDIALLGDGQWSSTNRYITFGWEHMYKLISDANNALFYIPKIAVLNEAQIKQFTAEVRFLRSISYIDLTDAWGPVVLATEADLANPNYEAKPTPASVEEIDKLVISDLEYAAANLPLNYVNHPIYPTNDVGRATKGAALTLLCKLYMRQHQWQKAADVAQQVMGLGYELYPSYEGLFAESNKWCKESIFSSLANALNDATELMNHFGPMVHPEVADRWQYYAVSWYFWNSFAANDDRKQMFFYDYVGSDGLHYVQPIAGQPTPPAGYYYLPDVATRKYADPAGSKTYYDGHGIPILRYADVLLCKAEALNELSGPTTESINLVNQVKARSHATLLGNAATFTKETLRDAILKERGWEFFFECKRRQDLIRMGKYQEVTNAYLTAIGKTPAINIAKHKYYTYPQTQVDLNPNLSNADRQ